MDIVALIPGFLGFDRIGDQPYFAPNVEAALRKALPAGTSIEHMTIAPTSSLLARQESLHDQLVALAQRLPDARFHLVGHSAGGVDAELLLVDRTVAGKRWDAAYRQSIRSVIALAAPLAGTTLADSPAAQVMATDSLAKLLKGLQDGVIRRGIASFTQAVRDILDMPRADAPAMALLRAAFKNPFQAGRYLNLLLKRGLVFELAPGSMATRMQAAIIDTNLPPVRRARFLTVARGNGPTPANAGPSQKLFDLLSAELRAQASDAPCAVGAAILSRNLPVFGESPLPPIDTDAASDGVVNTLRQVLRSGDVVAPEELARVKGIAIADHADVIGYFAGTNSQDGFLKSGSGFDQRGFEKLYGAIAAEIVAAMTAAP